MAPRLEMAVSVMSETGHGINIQSFSHSPSFLYNMSVKYFAMEGILIKTGRTIRTPAQLTDDGPSEAQT